MFQSKGQRIPLLLLLLSIILGMAVALKTGPTIRLHDFKKYMFYSSGNKHNNSVIECIYELNPGEEVAEVSYELKNGTAAKGRYTWKADNSESTATGALEGVVKLTQSEGKLNLTRLRYDLSGDYVCEVVMKNGSTFPSAKFHVVIVDAVGNTSLLHKNGDCGFGGNFNGPTMFPEPLAQAGMFSKALGGYYQTLPQEQWQRNAYPNGSVAYSFSQAAFQIDPETPMDIVFRVSLSFFVNGKEIVWTEMSTNASSWRDMGCSDLQLPAHTEVTYLTSASSCRGGRKNGTRGTITCMRGYHGKGEGAVSLAAFRCDGITQRWGPVTTIQQPEDLVCVENKDNGGAKAGQSGAMLVLSVFLASLTLLGKGVTY